MKHHDHGADATRFIRETLYLGPVYRKLYTLRERRPDIAHDLDDLATSLRELGDQLEEFVRDRLTARAWPAPAPGVSSP